MHRASIEVDAFTFSNSLIALGEALQEINRQVNPDFSIEIVIEGVGPGSFRAKLRTQLKSIGGLFKTSSREVIIGLLVCFIYSKLQPESEKITVDESEVIIQRGHDRIIIPRSVWSARERLQNPKEVQRHIARAFATLEDDPSVTEFGVSGALDDPAPAAVIPRDDFAALAIPEEPSSSSDAERYRDYHTQLTIIKAIFQKGSRKWEFVWQSHKISAPIRDDEFFDRLAAREIWFAQGDELDVMLRVHQSFDEINKVYINEWYEVIKVFGVNHRGPQPKLFGGE